jgi:hypothetical protein
MKRYILLTSIALVTLASCGKKDKPVDPEVSARIGNFVFYSSGKMVTAKREASVPSGPVSIEGLMSNGATLRLWIRSYVEKPGILNMDSTDAAATYLPPTPSLEVRAVRGTLSITQVTPVVTGTYFFVCNDSTAVNGSFKINPL